jgi:hypothetical protein
MKEAGSKLQWKDDRVAGSGGRATEENFQGVTC